MPSQLSGAQRPITAFFSQGSQSRLPTSKRRRDVSSNGPQLQESERPKKKLKENLAPSKRETPASESSASTATRPPSARLQNRRKPVVVQTAGFATPLHDATGSRSSNSPKTRSRRNPVHLDLTTSDTSPRPRRRLHAPSFLPTPATTARHSSSASPPPANQTLAGKEFTFHSTLQGRVTATPITHLPRQNVQLPTPVTPTRRRPKADLQLDLSPLSSPPSTPVSQSSRRKDNVFVGLDTIASANVAEGSPTVVTSSETQALDLDRLFSPTVRSSNSGTAKFKLPALPVRGRCSIPGHQTTGSDDLAPEASLVSSSQSQDLATFFASSLTPTSARRYRDFLTADGAHASASKAGWIPSSQSLESELQLPTSMKYTRDQAPRDLFSIRPHTNSSHHAKVVSVASIARPTSPLASNFENDIIPTSQYAIEKELSSSDFIEIPAIASYAGFGSSSSDSPKAAADEPTLPSLDEPRSPRLRRALQDPSTPSRQRCGPASDLRSSERKHVEWTDIPEAERPANERPQLAVIQQLPLNKEDKRLDVPSHTLDVLEKVDVDVDIVDSSQTEPESSQWRVPTQHIQSSMTEPESSQWRVPTQRPSQWRVEIQSSQTEPESSQWRVPTQYTPSRAKGKQRAAFPTDDSEDEDNASQTHEVSHSLPVASYQDESQAPSPTLPEAVSPKVASFTSLDGLGSQDEDLMGLDLNDPNVVRRLEHVRGSYLRKRGRFSSVRSDFGDNGDQQSWLSDVPLSIPSDYESLPSPSPT